MKLYLWLGEGPNERLVDQALAEEVKSVDANRIGFNSSSNNRNASGGPQQQQQQQKQEEVSSSSANEYSTSATSSVAVHQQQHQMSSVIQRLRPSSYVNVNGVGSSSGRNQPAASFYSYNQECSRSPSPARGKNKCPNDN